MIDLPNLLLIGAAERNVGKTELACQLIRKYKASTTVIGLKITVIKEKNGKCPRGGDGCGVCSSLLGNYSISTEDKTEGKKDTVKMLKAGAKAVYWLRVLESSLDEGVEKLFDRIHQDQKKENLCIICESNSARHAIKPGVFLVLRRKGSEKVKDSCKSVIDNADKIVSFDNGHDVLPEEQINFIDGRWYFKNNATVIIMAGGQSRRMGQKKAFLSSGNSTFLELLIKKLKYNFKEIIISANDKESYKKYGYKIVRDEVLGQGPLMGIYSSLKFSNNDINFVIACDIPEIDFNFINRLMIKADNADIVIPVVAKDKFEPLLAVYKKSALNAMKETLDSGQRKISIIFPKVKTVYVKEDNFDWYFNINTPEDYSNYIKSDSKKGY